MLPSCRIYILLSLYTFKSYFFDLSMKKRNFLSYIEDSNFYFGFLAGVGLFLGINFIVNLLVKFVNVIQNYDHFIFLIVYLLFFIEIYFFREFKIRQFKYGFIFIRQIGNDIFYKGYKQGLLAYKFRNVPNSRISNKSFIIF